MKNSRDNDIPNKRNKHLSIYSDYKSFCKERVSLTRNGNEEINISQSDLEFISPIILKKLNKLNQTEKVISYFILFSRKQDFIYQVL